MEWQTLAMLLGVPAVIISAAKIAQKYMTSAGVAIRWSFTVSCVDIKKLEDDAAAGRASKQMAESIVRTAELKVSEANGRAAQSCQQCIEVSRDRDRLARQVAKLVERG